MKSMTKFKYFIFLILFTSIPSIVFAGMGAPLVIGVPTSLGLLEGKESLNAVKMAVDEINASGGVMIMGEQRKFVVEAIDLRDGLPGVPVQEALLGLEKIILEKKPVALLVGPFRSEALLAGMDILAKYKMPLLGTIAMSPGTQARIKKNPEKYKYIFRVSMNVIYWARLLSGGMSELNKSFGFNSAYLFNQDVAWAKGTTGFMQNVYYKKAKWDVKGREEFPTGAHDFFSSLRKVKNSKADVLFVTFDMPSSGILIKQWRILKVPSLMVGFISPAAGEKAWKTFDGKIGGMMNAIFELGNMPSGKYPPAEKFYNAYKTKYGVGINAGHGPAPSYESVYILKDALEKANSDNPDKLVTALEQTDRKGVMGKIRFSADHQVIYGTDPNKEAVGLFFQWTEDGRRKIVFPPSLAEGKIILPKK